MRTQLKSLVATLLIPCFLAACPSTHGVAQANPYSPVASVADKPQYAPPSPQRPEDSAFGRVFYGVAFILLLPLVPLGAAIATLADIFDAGAEPAKTSEQPQEP